MLRVACCMLRVALLERINLFKAQHTTVAITRQFCLSERCVSSMSRQQPERSNGSKCSQIVAKTLLSNKGYSVRKRLLSTTDCTALKKSLTVTPLAHPDYPFVNSFSVYEEGQNWIRIPRCFGLARFGKPDRDCLNDRPLEESHCLFDGELRPSQVVPHDTMLAHLCKTDGTRSGLLCCSTGLGKTFCAVSIISRLRQRTCILLHKSQLLQQWHAELRRFLPNASIGIVQGKAKDFSTGCDVYLVMIQTLLNISTVPPIFGMTIVDEVHHIPSNTFSRVLFKVNAKYLLGLTATPERKDNLSHVMQWHMGDIAYQERPDRRDQPTTSVEIYRHETRGIDPRKYAEMITKLCEDPARNRLIVDAIEQQLGKDVAKQRRLLVLTERKTHATLIWDTLRTMYGPDQHDRESRTCGLMLGGMKRDILETSMEAMIIVATYNLMSEGISIPQLNTIVFATPKRDVVQALGRIFRKVHTEVAPMIIDISDKMLKGQQAARLSTYKKELNGNIRITTHDVENDHRKTETETAAAIPPKGWSIMSDDD